MSGSVESVSLLEMSVCQGGAQEERDQKNWSFGPRKEEALLLV